MKIKHPIKFIFKGILYRFIVGWCICIPLSIIIPKNKKQIVFIPRMNNRFADNVKYLYLYLYNNIDKDQRMNIYYLCEDAATFNTLNDNNLPVIFYPKISSIWKLLRAGVVIVDSNEWLGNFKPHLLYRSYKIQLWHGVGMKKVGNSNPIMQEYKKRMLTNIYSKIIIKSPFYDLLVLSSELQIKEKANMFRYKNIFINGQPRNDIFFNKKVSSNVMLGVDASVLNKVEYFKKLGKKIILYTPTWRNNADTIKLETEAVDYNRLSNFCMKNEFIFILKQHPKSKSIINCRYENIIEYQKNLDLYPLFSLIDVLITDYSSIYTDFILMNKPVIFYNYDYEYYNQKEDRIHFNYGEITPGKKCSTQIELEEELHNLFYKGDNYIDERKVLLDNLFEYQDGYSSERLWRYLVDINITYKL
ncbi:CDP-glycerol--poly(glycerophosphate) glycerophosphotransferase [Evansella cellulosilytica]|uniref:CDP-glycerol:poly(Glycerophosphate) glycerophosphotransferase n=1 Tax=Evansella cellulosilytica (strain ATCC 21833 / DSM 2522 / FERM P-1141 / JCM 9156 / N-4) TaxID=649639 RepID=E6TS85_EVAC2|nr:CDP-glycerol--poly(glycerophosphate) glycerophosphotransferase [Evansella cellulosilytica]ADU31854.1 CDP-glycerol:poly(glycerophosphate) glycerophosphotransferase [Evansella cellulosilytica DSM 2522]